MTLAAPALERLRAARRIVTLTGAGISAESGLPTFRDPMTGLWARYRPEDLATPEAFARQPDLVWRWYEWRRSLVAAAEPNTAHRALVALERSCPDFTLVTQNVDGLHQRAGSPDVVELHGNLARTICSRERIPVERWPAGQELPPPCPSCGAPLRPDVVWFGEALPAGALHRATAAAAACDVLLAIGTSGVVYPAAGLPAVAAAAGALILVVNPEEVRVAGPAVHHLRGPAARVLPALVAAAFPGTLV
jgi:NAD-dependent deacetylase